MILNKSSRRILKKRSSKRRNSRRRNSSMKRRLKLVGGAETKAAWETPAVNEWGRAADDDGTLVPCEVGDEVKYYTGDVNLANGLPKKPKFGIVVSKVDDKITIQTALSKAARVRVEVPKIAIIKMEQTQEDYILTQNRKGYLKINDINKNRLKYLKKKNGIGKKKDPTTPDLIDIGGPPFDAGAGAGALKRFDTGRRMGRLVRDRTEDVDKGFIVARAAMLMLFRRDPAFHDKILRSIGSQNLLSESITGGRWKSLIRDRNGCPMLYGITENNPFTGRPKTSYDLCTTLKDHWGTEIYGSLFNVTLIRKEWQDTDDATEIQAVIPGVDAEDLFYPENNNLHDTIANRKLLDGRKNYCDVRKECIKDTLIVGVENAHKACVNAHKLPERAGGGCDPMGQAVAEPQSGEQNGAWVGAENSLYETLHVMCNPRGNGRFILNLENNSDMKVKDFDGEGNEVWRTLAEVAAPAVAKVKEVAAAAAAAAAAGAGAGAEAGAGRAGRAGAGRAGRAGAGAGVELRVDPQDGHPHTLQEFVHEYGVGRGGAKPQEWLIAHPYTAEPQLMIGWFQMSTTIPYLDLVEAFHNIGEERNPRYDDIIKTVKSFERRPECKDVNTSHGWSGLWRCRMSIGVKVGGEFYETTWAEFAKGCSFTTKQMEKGGALWKPFTNMSIDTTKTRHEFKYMFESGIMDHFCSREFQSMLTSDSISHTTPRQIQSLLDSYKIHTEKIDGGAVMCDKCGKWRKLSKKRYSMINKSGNWECGMIYSARCDHLESVEEKAWNASKGGGRRKSKKNRKRKSNKKRQKTRKLVKRVTRRRKKLNRKRRNSRRRKKLRKNKRKTKKQEKNK